MCLRISSVRESASLSSSNCPSVSLWHSISMLRMKTMLILRMLSKITTWASRLKVSTQKAVLSQSSMTLEIHCWHRLPYSLAFLSRKSWTKIKPIVRASQAALKNKVWLRMQQMVRAQMLLTARSKAARGRLEAQSRERSKSQLRCSRIWTTTLRRKSTTIWSHHRAKRCSIRSWMTTNSAK